MKKLTLSLIAALSLNVINVFSAAPTPTVVVAPDAKSAAAAAPAPDAKSAAVVAEPARLSVHEVTEQELRIAKLGQKLATFKKQNPNGYSTAWRAAAAAINSTGKVIYYGTSPVWFTVKLGNKIVKFAGKTIYNNPEAAAATLMMVAAKLTQPYIETGSLNTAKMLDDARATGTSVSSHAKAAYACAQSTDCIGTTARSVSGHLGDAYASAQSGLKSAYASIPSMPSVDFSPEHMNSINDHADGINDSTMATTAPTNSATTKKTATSTGLNVPASDHFNASPSSAPGVFVTTSTLTLPSGEEVIDLDLVDDAQDPGFFARLSDIFTPSCEVPQVKATCAPGDVCCTPLLAQGGFKVPAIQNSTPTATSTPAVTTDVLATKVKQKYSNKPAKFHRAMRRAAADAARNAANAQPVIQLAPAAPKPGWFSRETLNTFAGYVGTGVEVTAKAIAGAGAVVFALATATE